MKKIYLFLSAATVMSVANAGGRLESVPFAKVTPNVESTIMKTSPLQKVKAIASFDKTKALSTRADNAEDFIVYYRPANDVMAIGMSTNGYGMWGATLGFASSYGNIVFNNYSTGYSSLLWKYSGVGDVETVDNELMWDVVTSDVKDLEVKSGIGLMMNPELTIKDASGKELAFDNSYVQAYFCGGSASDWIGDDELGGMRGASFYQNYGMLDADGYSGTVFYNNSYQPGAQNFNENGVYVNPADWTNWQSFLEEMANAKLENLAIENYTFLQNKPASPYMMSVMWGPLNVSATADTQLISYIYPVEENGISETPIALGYASIPKGDTNIPIFEYVALNEDGDELEEPIIIDSEVAITVEGFVGNEAIKSISPSSGYYPFDFRQYDAGNVDVIAEPSMYMLFTFDMDGEKYQTLQFLSAIGGFDPTDENSATLFAYHQLCVDAVFPFIHAVNGEESVNVAEAGGDVIVDLTSYWIGFPELVQEGYYKVTSPDWIKVSFGEESQDGVTPMILTVDATPTGRTGVVSIKGDAENFELKVIQGEDAVNAIVLDSNAVYYDLAGRRVANPDKGVYIKKTANKAEKVIF